MTRYDFGGTLPDYVFNQVAVSGTTGLLHIPSGTVTLTFWSAKAGGTQYTGLRLATAPTVDVSSVTMAADGSIPEFQGPDGVTSMFASAGGTRVRIVTWTPGVGGTPGTVVDATTSVKGIVQLAGDLAGTAAAPTVPGLTGKAALSHTHAGSDIANATTSATGVVRLSGDLAGTALQPTVPGLLTHTHLSTAITDTTTTGRNVMKAADAAAARTVIDAIGNTDFPRSFTGTAGGDVVTWDDQALLWVNRPPPSVALPPYLLQGAVFNPGQTVPADWPNGAIAFVRASAPVVGAIPLGKNGINQTGTTTLSVAISDPVSVGDLVFVNVTAPAPGSVLSSVTVTDSGANTYTMRGQRLQGTTLQGQIFSGRATTAMGAGGTVTVTFGASAGADLEMQVTKLSGTVVSPFDQSGQASGAGVTTLSVASGGATAQANEIAVLSLHWNNGTVVDPNSWTTPGWQQVGTTQTMGTATPKNVATFWKQFTVVSTVAATPQISTTGTMVGLLATYKTS